MQTPKRKVLVRAKEFEQFALWYEGRSRRQRGRAPAPATLRQKMQGLASICNEPQQVGRLSPTDSPTRTLVELVSHRDLLESTIERWLAQGSSSHARNRLYALKDYGDYLVALGELPSHVVLKSDIPPMAPAPPITIYRPEEVEMLVSAARGRGLRWWALMAFLADTGRRIGEALALEWTWFDLRHSPPYIDIPKTKNGDQQYIPLTRRLATDVFTPDNIEALRTEPRHANRYVLRSAAIHPFPWTYNTVHQWFAAHCDRLGIEHRGLHNFRHTLVSNRLAAGVPPQAVSALAGHRSLATTMQRYAHATSLDYWRFIEPPEGVAG